MMMMMTMMMMSTNEDTATSGIVTKRQTRLEKLSRHTRHSEYH